MKTQLCMGVIYAPKYEDTMYCKEPAKFKIQFVKHTTTLIVYYCSEHIKPWISRKDVIITEIEKCNHET